MDLRDDFNEKDAVYRVPPPGYTGPTNGPFTWAGAGEPPDGVYVTDGKPLAEPIPRNNPVDVKEKATNVAAKKVNILDGITDYIYNLIYS